ncbi:MAG: sensor histidine kinase, partial [Anaerolineales bacterium]|nr:sensor histidine kinase [Anaerolineales bacterium]
LALRQELTNLIQQLRPAELEGKGLPAAINDYAEEWSRQAEIQAEVRIRRQRALPLEIEQTIFRIVQEALSNIARHSKASQVEIDLFYSTDNVTCTIQDNGAGFNPDSINKGLGLRSMDERAAGLDGTLAIASKPGEGTSITMSVPIIEARDSDLEEQNG